LKITIVRLGFFSSYLFSDIYEWSLFLDCILVPLQLVVFGCVSTVFVHFIDCWLFRFHKTLLSTNEQTCDSMISWDVWIDEKRWIMLVECTPGSKLWSQLVIEMHFRLRKLKKITKRLYFSSARNLSFTDNCLMKNSSISSSQ
jgi:hypothetical protein